MPHTRNTENMDDRIDVRFTRRVLRRALRVASVRGIKLAEFVRAAVIKEVEAAERNGENGGGR